MKRFVLLLVLVAGMLIPVDASARIFRRWGGYSGGYGSYYRPYVSTGIYVGPRTYARPYYGGYGYRAPYYGYSGYRGYYSPYYGRGFSVYPGGMGMGWRW